MNRTEVRTALSSVAKLVQRRRDAERKARGEVNVVLSRVLHEAVAQRMSPRDIANEMKWTATEVRRSLRQVGIDPRLSKGVLSDLASKTLASNADLLGVDVKAIDMMSPMMYLPLGAELTKLLDRPVDIDAALEEGTYGDAHQLAAKLTDAGLGWDEAVDWVNETIRAGATIPEGVKA